MLSVSQRGAAWRWLIIAVLLAAMVLPFMPSAAYAASDTTTVASAGQDVSWYGYACSDYYRVQRGDHLLRIARWYGVSLHDIAAANGISNPSRIYPGQRLCIPAGYTGGDGYYGGCWYTVRSGDNLSRIASWYGTSWTYLARINHLSNARVIIPGQVLYVCH